MASEKYNLLDGSAVAKGEALGLIARQIVEGYRVGEHRSPFHGFAIEFAQHREYSTGDDVKHLDWKVLGRTDRYYIKQYEQDTNFVAHLLIDGSESMNYGSDEKLTKMQYAKILAACISYIVLGQRDAVALNLFNTEIRERFSRTDNPRKIHDIMHQLAEFKANGETKLAKSMADLAAAVKSRSIVILISDLFDEENLQQNVERIRFQGSEVIVFHVLDPKEIEFPFTGTVKFVGLENSGILQTSPAAIRKSYLKTFDEFRARMRRICDRTGSHYILANTGTPIGETLSEYLAFRQNHRTR